MRYLLILFLLIPLKIIAQTGIVLGTVTDQYGALPGVKIAVEGQPIATKSDVDGTYRLEVPAGIHMLNASFITYVTERQKIEITDGDTLRVDYILKTASDIDQQFTLGSRADPRSLLETTAPVDIISPKDISSTNQIELSHILHYLTPSFHSTYQTIADGTDHIDPATLRGLGPDQVLVLVNGKRRHTSSLLNVNGTVGRGTVGTDFNAIPVAAIDRIEILRDGATSQYGSDAIAGVVNIILKSQTRDIIVDTRTQINTEGDGFTTYGAANFGLTVGEKGFVNVTAEFRDRDATNRAGNYTGTVYTDDRAQDNILIGQNNFFENTGYEDQRVMQIGTAQTQNISLAFNSEFPISETSSLYAYGLRNYREGKAKGFYRFPKDPATVVLALYPNGFSPSILTDIQDDAISVGFKGIKNYWNVNFSHTIGINRLDFSVANSNNASLDVASPTIFAVGGYFYRQNTTNMDISRSFDYLEGINIAFGAELRVENYQIKAGEEASYIDGGATFTNAADEIVPRTAGAQVFPGFQPQNELNKFRTNSSGYVDVETEVNKRLLINAAARYETYSDFGGQGIWKVSGRYKFQDRFSVRMGYATGYRAPSLHQVFFNNISTQFEDGEAIQVGTFNNQSAVAEAFDIEKLSPELSRHISAGFTARILDNLTFTFDYYHIKIRDRIVLSGKFDEGYEAILEPLNVGAAQFFTNAVDSRTTGADGVFVYKSPLWKGEFSTSLAANVTKTSIISPIRVPSFLVGQEQVLFNREEIGRVERAQPEFKVVSILNYGIDKFRFRLGNTYFGSVSYVHPDDGNSANWVLNSFTGNVESRDQRFSPKLLTDLSITYEVGNFLECTLAGNNIFNVYPDKHTHSANVGDGNFVYSRRVQQFGVLGANYAVRLLLKL